MRTEDSLTLRHNLFKKIARKIWQRVAAAHSFGLNLDERGITPDIIVEILTFCKKHKMAIGLFADRGKLEDQYGSDMDIFIEIEHDKYIWFALTSEITQKKQQIR